MRELKHILKPIRIKSLELKNRVVMPPMATMLGNLDSSVSDALVAYITRRAKGGAGLIIPEYISVMENGIAAPMALGIWDDRFIPGLSMLCDAVHGQGSRICLQLHHCGRETRYKLQTGDAFAPSALPSFILGIKPREMTREDIQDLINAYGDAAVRAREAGADALEVHSAHGYLLNQFLCGHANQRSDEYGGDMHNRSRIHREVLQEIRKRMGDDYPIFLRISVEENLHVEGGYSVEDIQPIMPSLVEAGADVIDVSFATQGLPPAGFSAPYESAPGFKAHLSRRIKDVVDVPVISVGRYTNLFQADEVIARGDTDLVAFGRQHLADPDFLINAIQGRPQDTVECIACRQGCIERLIFDGKSLRCAINPETGQELVYPKGPAGKRSSVWIIGAGPAGLTAAFEAARLGHTVTLFDSNDSTGGQVRFGAMAPYKQVYGDWIQTLTVKVRNLGVDVRTNTHVTETMIIEGDPDHVILATGGVKVTPLIEGIRLPHVCSAAQILMGEVEPKDNALVIGAGLVGLETADYIRARGSNNLKVIEMLPEKQVNPATTHGYMLYKRLKHAGYSLMFNTQVKRIEESSVKVCINSKEQMLSPVDQVIIAVGVTPRSDLKDVLKERGIPHHVVGDALKARRIMEATEEGGKAAWEL